MERVTKCQQLAGNFIQAHGCSSCFVNWWVLLILSADLWKIFLLFLLGNIHDTALLKLQSAGVLTDLFRVDETGTHLFGAFGSDHGNRSHLVKIAQERYEKILGGKISPNDMVIIGDSPKDIACAHANNVPCVAVTTGVHCKEDLETADYLLSNGFENIEESIKAILETRRLEQ